MSRAPPSQLRPDRWKATVLGCSAEPRGLGGSTLPLTSLAQTRPKVHSKWKTDMCHPRDRRREDNFSSAFGVAYAAATSGPQSSSTCELFPSARPQGSSEMITMTCHCHRNQHDRPLAGAGVPVICFLPPETGEGYLGKVRRGVDRVSAGMRDGGSGPNVTRSLNAATTPERDGLALHCRSRATSLGPPPPV